MAGKGWNIVIHIPLTNVYNEQVELQYKNAGQLGCVCKSDKTGTDLVRRSVTMIMLLQSFSRTCISTFTLTPNR